MSSNRPAMTAPYLNGQNETHSAPTTATVDDHHHLQNGVVEPAISLQLPGTRTDLTEHVIQLSSIDHCMPRAYIRVCLAYRLTLSDSADSALKGLGQFLHRAVHAAPFLAGYVDPACDSDGSIGRVLVRFTEANVRDFPVIQYKTFTLEEMPWTYDQLDQCCLPPSIIRPETVSALPEDTGAGRAPVFRVQANLLEGGMIVSVYLHHCVSDGTGLGFLLSGYLGQTTLSGKAVASQAHTPPQHGLGNGLSDAELDLAGVAAAETESRRQLCSSLGSDRNRKLGYKWRPQAKADSRSTKQAGRGCVFLFTRTKLAALKSLITLALGPIIDNVEHFLSDHDILQTLLWHCCIMARASSLLPEDNITTSHLLIPVNIRNRMQPPLPATYFGSAVDSASVELPVSHLTTGWPTALAATALAIRHAVNAVQDKYVRMAIALSNTPNIDVRDLQASNMNRATGADMYITSWLNLPLYDKGDLGMGLGMPDWVRKPWSRDPGACIILPQDPRKDCVEVVVQLTEADMARLLRNKIFMEYVNRVIE